MSAFSVSPLWDEGTVTWKNWIIFSWLTIAFNVRFLQMCYRIIISSLESCKIRLLTNNWNCHHHYLESDNDWQIDKWLSKPAISPHQGLAGWQLTTTWFRNYLIEILCTCIMQSCKFSFWCWCWCWHKSLSETGVQDITREWNKPRLLDVNFFLQYLMQILLLLPLGYY